MHDTFMLIYKILRPTEWAELQTKGETNGAPIDLQDGYIHFSSAVQAAETAAKHFASDTDLILLAYSAEDLGDALVWEKSRGDQLFPHLYAPLRLRDMVWAKDLPLGDDGHLFPDEMI